MKKILLLVISIAITTSSFGQKFQFGLTGAPNFTMLSKLKSPDLYKFQYYSETAENYNIGLGFHLGCLTKVSLGKNFAISGELLYSKYNLNYTWYHNTPVAYPTSQNPPSEDYVPYSGHLRLNALTIPVLIVKHFSLGTEKLELSAGVQADLFLSGKIKVSNPIYGSYNGKVEIGNSYERSPYSPSVPWNLFSYGIKMGVGYQYKDALFRINYYQGLTDVDPESQRHIIFYPSINVSSIQLYSFSASLTYFLTKSKE